MADKRIHEGYGTTSEQRQRHLSGDNFSERAPHTPEEAEAERVPPSNDGTVVTLHPLSDAEDTTGER